MSSSRAFPADAPDVLTRIWERVEARPVSIWIALLFAILIVKVGTWVIPNIAVSALIATDLRINPLANPFSQYLMWNWFGPAVAHVTRATSVPSFIALHYLVCAVSFFGYVSLLVRSLRQEDRRLGPLLFFCTPMAGTVWYWVGMDTFTFAAMAGIVFARRIPVASFLLGIILGLNHFEQGLVAFSLLLIASVLAARSGSGIDVSWRWCALVLAGIAVGKLLLIAWFAINGIAPAGRATWVAAHWRNLVRQWLAHPHAIVYSVLGAMWLITPILWQRLASLRAALLLPILLVVGLTVIVDDETRVAGLVLFPLMHFAIVTNPRVHEVLSNQTRALLLIAYAVIPFVWCWQGFPRPSVFGHDMAFVVDALTGSQNVGSGSWAYLGPFLPPSR